ncbi:hypothetical protein BDZ89DRAFT_1147317, partial [Hymenopellis radicata]
MSLNFFWRLKVLFIRNTLDCSLLHHFYHGIQHHSEAHQQVYTLHRSFAITGPFGLVPQELLDLIIASLANDKASLLSCALVHPSWTSISRYYLPPLNLVVSSPSRAKELTKLLRSSRETFSWSISGVTLSATYHSTLSTRAASRPARAFTANCCVSSNQGSHAALRRRQNDPSLVRILAQYFPDLTNLKVSCGSYQDIPSFMHALSGSFPQLAELCIERGSRGMDIPDAPLFGLSSCRLSVPCLRTLRVVGWNNELVRWLGDNVVGTLECLELESASVRSTCRVEEAISLIRGNMETLKDLRLISVKRDVAFDLSGLLHLQNLEVASGMHETELALWGWRLPRSLKRVYVRNVVTHVSVIRTLMARSLRPRKSTVNYARLARGNTSESDEVPDDAVTPDVPDDDHSSGSDFAPDEKQDAEADDDEDAAVAVEWHEEWKDLEDYIHPGGYNPNTPVTYRVRSAAMDFARIRMWPREFDSNASMPVREQWDQFQIFIGIIMTMPIWNKVVEGAPEDQDDGADFSDEESTLSGAMTFAVRISRNRSNLALLTRTMPKPPPSSIPTRYKVPILKRMRNFLIFATIPRRWSLLSSYIIDQELIYSDRFLFTIPRLVRVFLNYLLKNDVLDGRADELKSSLKVADLAIVELLQTSKIAKALPDALNNALSASFSSKVTPEEDAFTKSLQEQGVEFVSIDIEIAVVKDAVEDNVDAEHGGWGVPTTDWKLPKEKTLSTLLDATAHVLTITHTTGVVESSTRRVTAIVHPADAASSELASKFSKVVLTPWPNARVNHPVIEENSKGHVLAEDEGSAPGAHNPRKGGWGMGLE